MAQMTCIVSNSSPNGFGGRLKEERQRLKLTQADFAKLAGVSRASQAHYEQEQRVPDLLYLSALSDKVDVAYIISGESIAKHSAKAIDSKVIEPILAAIDVWAAETNRKVSQSLRAELLALFLQQAVSTGKVESDWMKKTLRLVK